MMNMENEYICADGVGMTPDLLAGCAEVTKDGFQIDKTNNKIMKHRFLPALIAALAMVLTLTPASAQKNNESDDYNLRKAYEVLNEDKDEDKAMQLVCEQLRSTPDNADALLLRTRLFRNKSQYGNALADINHAIKVNKPKKTEIPQSTLYWWRAYVYSDMDEEEKSEADLKTAMDLARKNKDENLPKISFDYAKSLLRSEKYDESEAVLNSMLKENEADLSAMVGIANIYTIRERYAEAVELLDKAEKIDGRYSEIYRFRMKAYDKMGESAKAVDDAVKYLEKEDISDNSDPAFGEILLKRYNYAVAKIKAAIKNNENPMVLRLLLASLYENKGDYVPALKEYDSLMNDYGDYPMIHQNKADCYDNLGMLDKAIEEATEAMGDEPGYFDYCLRGGYYRDAGRYEEALADYTSAIEDAPDLAYGYYERGLCYKLIGDFKKAMEDYNLGVDMDENDSYLFLLRGKLLLAQGEKDKADADFERILQIDTTAEGNTFRMYALHFLGKDDEAAKCMQDVIDKEPDDKGNYYNKACLYSLMGRLDEAVEAFKKCLDMGYRSFGYLEHDDDLDPIRDREDFKAALAEAKEKAAAIAKEYETSNPEKEEKVFEVALKRKSGGTFEVPCEINGLPLQMIFDTGASDVSISSVEANFMLKNSYLKSSDIKGKRYYQVANGSLSEGTVITLREVKIGEAVLHNVDASVVGSQNAPLLFGQSAMEKFGKIAIDNEGKKLIIKQ